VTNDGSTELASEDITVSTTGANADAFSATELNQSIVPGETVPVVVTADPPTTEEVSGNLDVSLNGDTRTVSLSATGIQPAAEFDQRIDNTDFENTSVNSSSVSRLRINNTGNQTLRLSNLSISQNGSAFSIVGSQRRVNLSTGETTTVGIAFSPTETGNLSGNLTIETNEDEDPPILSQDLNGNAVEENASLSPAVADFGEIQLTGTATETRNLTLTNDGRVNVSIGTISIRNNEAGVFERVSADVSEGDTLDSGVSQNITIEADPTIAGSATATLEIEVGDENVTATLAAVGVEPDIALSAQSISFNRTRLGETRTQDLVVRNTGNAPLNVTEITLEGDQPGRFVISPTSPTEPTISAGNAETVQLAYAPPVTDVDAAKNGTTQTATLSVDSDDANEGTINVSISGVAKTPELEVQRSLRFGLLRVGDAVSRTLIIRMMSQRQRTLP
jgi:hypothetical protein